MPRYAALPDNYAELFAEHWRRTRLVDPSEAYRDPLVLQDAIIEYFEWNAQNPILSNETYDTKRSGLITREHKLFRTPSQKALCLRIGISSSLWRDWRTECRIRRPVIYWAEDVISTMKLEAASVDLINPTIAIRELGLKDSHELTGADGQPLNDVSYKDILIEKLTRVVESSRDSVPYQRDDGSSGS